MEYTNIVCFVILRILCTGSCCLCSRLFPSLIIHCIIAFLFNPLINFNSLSPYCSMSSSSTASSTEQRVPRLASSSGKGSGLPYAIWRPQLQTFMMRQGIEERDYTKEIPQWKALVASVEEDAEAAELAAIAMVLGNQQKSVASSSSESSLNDAVKSEPAAGAVKDKQALAKRQAGRTDESCTKAYGHLYTALPADLRLLVADVPQGYAFGIWTFIKNNSAFANVVGRTHAGQ